MLTDKEKMSKKIKKKIKKLERKSARLAAKNYKTLHLLSETHPVIRNLAKLEERITILEGELSEL